MIHSDTKLIHAASLCHVGFREDCVSNGRGGSLLPPDPGTTEIDRNTSVESQLLRRLPRKFLLFFPTCQVRVVRFYVSCLPPPSAFRLLPPASSSSSSSSSLSFSSSSSSSSNRDPRSTLFGAGPQPRPSMLSVPCRTSTTTIHAQCSLPDLNHDLPRPVFPAGPQPRPSTPSVPCRTSTASIHAKCSLPDLNREYPRQKICHTSARRYARQNVRRYAR